MPARRKKTAAGSVGLEVREVGAGAPPPEVLALAEQVAADGGVALARYRDPFGGKWVVLAALPLAKVEPTPYQRELSDTHAKRLTGVIEKLERFLDPVIAVRHEKGYWTPNGMHRLEAMRRLGAKTIMALVLPEAEVAYRILALNTEKAHNLKDKSLEVIRMAHGLAGDAAAAKRPESDWAFEFEEAAYLALGACYEENLRFSGGAYLPIARRCVEFSGKPLAKSLEEHARRAKLLQELDAVVAKCVEKLKAAGLKSPYLKPFVVARLNPLRWIKPAKPGQKSPRADFDATIEKMLSGAKQFDASKIRPQDLSVPMGALAEE